MAEARSPLLANEPPLTDGAHRSGILLRKFNEIDGRLFVHPALFSDVDSDTFTVGQTSSPWCQIRWDSTVLGSRCRMPALYALDNPNCRAIKDGLMPALNAARTALICPRGNETVATSCRLWSVRDDRFGTDSSNSPLGGDLPRRFASSTHAVISRSSS